MSEFPSYQSRIADLNLKRFDCRYQPAYGQATSRDNDLPRSTDDNPISLGREKDTEPSAMNDLKGLFHDQAGMEWESSPTLCGRTQDDSPAHPGKPEGRPYDKKVEVLDEKGQDIGRALAHETSLDPTSRIAREHPFYKLKPDGNGQYHCPYTSLEECWYKPQKLRSKFHEHLDTHLKPYRCNVGGCVDAQFSFIGGLLRHETEVHHMHRPEAKNYSVHSHSGDGLSKETTTPSFERTPLIGDVSANRTEYPSKKTHARCFQNAAQFLRNEFEDVGDVSERVGGLHVSASPAALHGKTLSSELNDDRGKRRVNLSDKIFEAKYTVTSEPHHGPKPTIVPTTFKFEQPKDKQKIEVELDFLHELYSKISNLESRVEQCEGRPSSPTNSSISDGQESIESVSDHDDGSVREADDSHQFDNDIITIEPEPELEVEVKEEKQDKVIADRPSLTISRWKCYGTNRKLETFNDGDTPIKFHPGIGNKPLLAVTEEHCANGKFWRKQLAIASPAFFELLKDLSGHNLNDIALQDDVMYLTEPFMVLFLNRKQLVNYVENTSESDHVKDQAKFILNFMKTDFGDISRMLDNFESMTPPNLVKYCDLWMLYRPGTTIYSRANGEWEAFVIDSLDGMQVRRPSSDNSHTLTRLDVRAWSMNFDGEVFGRVWSIHCVAPFHGVKDISTLPLVPEKFLPNGKAIRESLLCRGRSFCASQLQQWQVRESYPSESTRTRVMVDHMTYQRRNGWLISINGKYGPSSNKDRSWTDNSYSDWDTSADALDRRPRRYTPYRSLVRHFENEYCNRDYVLESIDASEDTQAEACRSYSADRPSHVVVTKFDKYNLLESTAQMDELSLSLFPQHVRAFFLRDKLWRFVNVSQLEPVTCQENAWYRLALEEEYKDVLISMVSAHVDKASGFRGSAARKGLSILLHGEPGVGKTLTAESIAAYFSKPLFPVACSDIGTSVPKFEEKLEEISDYATEWGAVLLFDEADVLLQARRDYECSNLKRNELVSSFARFLDYYKGIVIITTNRVSRFDGALMPRIDLTLGLPPLNRDRRLTIWSNEIQDLLDDGTITESQSADLCALASDEWSRDDFNGHQIKKMVKAANVVAERKAQGLGRREIETMLKMERQFQERVGCWEKEKEKEKERKAGGKKDSGDMEEFEQVEKP